MNELEKRIDAVVEEFTHVYITHFERQQRKKELREAILALATPPPGHVRDDKGRTLEYEIDMTYDIAVREWCSGPQHKHEPGSRVWTSSGWMVPGDEKWSVYPSQAAEAARKEGGAC